MQFQSYVYYICIYTNTIVACSIDVSSSFTVHFFLLSHFSLSTYRYICTHQCPLTAHTRVHSRQRYIPTTDTHTLRCIIQTAQCGHDKLHSTPRLGKADCAPLWPSRVRRAAAAAAAAAATGRQTHHTPLYACTRRCARAPAPSMETRAAAAANGMTSLSLTRARLLVSYSCLLVPTEYSRSFSRQREEAPFTLAAAEAV